MAGLLEQAEFEAHLGHWPRRLLHVPTMTSYCWQPGNIYGSSLAPLYNAITYTWGRWELRTVDQCPAIRALDIQGVEWAIPRIDPEHFSQEDFMAAINRAVQAVPSFAGKAKQEGLSQERIEFLWLDIACIDQRRNSPDGAAEVGRQADIFRGAHNVFVWLTTLSGLQLTENLTAISIPRGLDPNARLPRPLDTIQQSLELLTRDPWFSSLWTLQEAFIRQDALFLARDGQLAADAVLAVVDGLNFPFCFRVLVRICSDLVRFINEEVWDLNSETTAEASTRHQTLVRRIGVTSGLQEGNPLAAFIASGQRTTSREPDRVYGIQQVFGFRLGSTAVGASQHGFTRSELEVQLGQEIIKRFPLMSQLFVTVEPVEFGKNWHINPGSTTYVGVLDPEWVETQAEPDLNDFQWLEHFHGDNHQQAVLEEKRIMAERVPTNLCSLATKLVDGHTWGHFRGKTIHFNTLLSCTKALTSELCEFARTSQDDLEGSEWEPMSLLMLELDRSDLTSGWPNGWRGKDDWVDEAEGCQWLSDQFPAQDLKVLGLASFTIRAFGLILARETVDSKRGGLTYWRRLGYCEWWMTDLLNDQDLRPGSDLEPAVIEKWEQKYGPCLRALSDEWVEEEGLFG